MGILGRREFLRGLTVAGTATAIGARATRVAAEPPPETRRLRIVHIDSTCVAPEYIAKDLLQAEGFTDVQYIKVKPADLMPTLASGDVDMGLSFSGPLIIQVDAGAPIVLVAGIHVGCYELFGTERVRAVRDLKGKTVAVTGLGLTQHVFLASMVAHVGLDPRKDVNFVAYPATEAKQLLAEGKVDAYLGFPPDPQELRAKKIGHVVVNSAVDRPWSQYFCCIATMHREFYRKNPVATKRAVRAMLKATDMCALEPERVAKSMVDNKFTPSYDYALQTLRDIPYARWRDYDAEDTVRFYALRLHEAGMIKSSPTKILAQGTDWRFFNELKKELKR
jgi:NitT/TauT family transport system substrate-binding protein